MKLNNIFVEENNVFQKFCDLMNNVSLKLTNIAHKKRYH